MSAEDLAALRLAVKAATAEADGDDGEDWTPIADRLGYLEPFVFESSGGPSKVLAAFEAALAFLRDGGEDPDGLAAKAGRLADELSRSLLSFLRKNSLALDLPNGARRPEQPDVAWVGRAYIRNPGRDITEWAANTGGPVRRPTAPLPFIPFRVAEAAAESGPLLWLEAAFADWLEELGERGRTTAEALRKAAEARWTKRDEDPEGLWTFWQPSPDFYPTEDLPPGSVDQRAGYGTPPRYSVAPPLAVVALVDALWFDKVQPELERERALRESAPGIRAARFNRALRPTVTGGSKSKLILEQDGAGGWHPPEARGRLVGTGRVVNPAVPYPVATIPAEAVKVAAHRKGELARAIRGASKLGTVNWHRLLHFAVVEPHRRLVAGVQEPGVLRFSNAGELARTLGAASKADPGAILDLLAFGQEFRFDFGDGFAPAQAWTYRQETAAPGRPAALELVIMPWLYGREPKGRSGDDAFLLFVPDRPAPLADKTNRRTHKDQWALWWTFLDWLRGRRAEIAAEGRITITDDDWRRLTDEAGWSSKLRASLFDALVARYTADWEDRLLIPERRNVYRPGPALEGVAGALARQNARALRQSASGKRSAASKARKDRKGKS